MGRPPLSFLILRTEMGRYFVQRRDDLSSHSTARLSHRDRRYRLISLTDISIALIGLTARAPAFILTVNTTLRYLPDVEARPRKTKRSSRLIRTLRTSSPCRSASASSISQSWAPCRRFFSR